MEPLEPAVLPPGIRSRFVSEINGLRMHVLEAGFETAARPLVLLLHGFPEIAYSWRRVMLPLAAAGFHVVAPDQRGYGRTTGWDADYDGDLAAFRLLNAVRDALGLVAALGYRSVAAVVGHDFGASVAAWCAMVRPDVFRRVALMSAPFAGPPELPFDTDKNPSPPATGPSIHEALAALARPRKHYQWYYSTRVANADMWHCKAGVHAFLRAYFHHKSADWRQNHVHRDKAALFQRVQAPPGDPLQPEATGAGMEATKCLKPPDSGHDIGDRASVQAATRVNAEQTSHGAVQVKGPHQLSIDKPPVASASRSEPDLYDRPVFRARSTSHTVAAHDGCTKIPLAAHRAQEDENHSRKRHFRPWLASVRPPGSARTDQGPGR